MNTLLVTGGAGFIGSAFVRLALLKKAKVVVLDSLTYAGHLPNIEPLLDSEKCIFVQGDICDQNLVLNTLTKFDVNSVINFAAESHVDNSINGPKIFIETNIFGTFNLLESAREYWTSLTEEKKNQFRYLNVSTDEVFGELGDSGYFTEKTPYSPNSPYSASKAASDHLVKSWHRTYGLPTITTNCSNNYGPRQFPEKLIPRAITCALGGLNIPVYGKGANVRDWIHVEDHTRGIWLALLEGKLGESYCFGGRSERKNLDVVKSICRILDELNPRLDGNSYETQISFVADRAGHDWRYSIDDSKSENELGFKREFTKFEDGLKETIKWYLDNRPWMTSVMGKKK